MASKRKRNSPPAKKTKVSRPAAKESPIRSPFAAKGANHPRVVSSPKRLALGRGLGALMSSAPVSVRSEERVGERYESRAQRENVWAEGNVLRAVNEERSFEPIQNHAPHENPTEGLHFLDISQVHANPSQPRRNFSEAEINELSQSIQESGVLQPIIVRPVNDGFEIVAGERRYRASLRAKLERIPALVRNLTDKESLQLAIVENIQRTDLNPLEEALAYQRLIDEFEETQTGVAEMVGKDRVSVANALRLLKLPPEVRAFLTAGKLTAGHGRALLMLEGAEKQLALAKKIVELGLSVRDAEGLAGGKSALAGKEKRGAKALHIERTPAESELEDRLRRGLGTKVAVQLNPSGEGEIRISFFSNAELQSVLERLGV